MYVDLECETELDEGAICDFVGYVDAYINGGEMVAECPQCNHEHRWDDWNVNPEEL